MECNCGCSKLSPLTRSGAADRMVDYSQALDRAYSVSKVTKPVIRQRVRLEAAIRLYSRIMDRYYVAEGQLAVGNNAPRWVPNFRKGGKLE